MREELPRQMVRREERYEMIANNEVSNGQRI